MNLENILKFIKNFIARLINKVQSSKVLNALLVIISFIYPIFLLAISWKEIKTIENIDYKSIVFMMLLYVSSMILQFINWTIILNQKITNFYNDLKIYTKTLLMQRLPGGFWHWIGRINFYNNSTNIKTDETIKASIFERILLIVSGVNLYISIKNIWIGVFSIIFTLIFVSLWRNKKSWKSIKQKGFFLFLTQWAIFIICWFLGGVILYIIIQFVDQHSSINLIKSVAVWSLTGSISLTFFFLPGGLGVKELSLSTLLQPELNFYQGIFIGLILRIFFLIMDMLIGSLGLLSFNIHEKRK